MAKVLLIEPDRITRQAIRLFLFPEHEVLTESRPGEIDAEDYDLLIVDGAALRDRTELTPDLMRVIQDCETPTIWLDDDERECSIKRTNLLFLQKPIAAEPFRLVLGQLLSGQDDDQKGKAAPPAAPDQEAPESREVIDLLDVVEEEPEKPPEKEPDGSG